MGNKFTTIKERFKQVADIKSISYKKLFEIIDMSDGGFKGANIKRPINSNAIENILTEFPDIDLHWLITGKEQKKAETPIAIVNEPAENYGVNYKEKYLQVLEKNSFLNEKIESLRQELKELHQIKLTEIENNIYKELEVLNKKMK